MTLRYEDPQLTGQLYGGYEWYYDEHCVVLYAVEDGMAFVSDSVNGRVKMPAARFFELFADCGSMAVVVA